MANVKLAEVANKGSLRVEQALSEKTNCCCCGDAGRVDSPSECYRKEGWKTLSQANHRGFVSKHPKHSARHSRSSRLVVRLPQYLSAGVAAQTLLTYVFAAALPTSAVHCPFTG